MLLQRNRRAWRPLVVAPESWRKLLQSSIFDRWRHSDCSVFSPHKIIWGPIPHLATTLETPCSPLLVGKSFMKIRSAVHENGCLINCGGRKKQKTEKKQKNIYKTYTHQPRRRLRKLHVHMYTLEIALTVKALQCIM